MILELCSYLPTCKVLSSHYVLGPLLSAPTAAAKSLQSCLTLSFCLFQRKTDHGETLPNKQAVF